MDPAGPLHLAAQAAFYCVAAGTAAGAVVAVFARNLFRAALGLAVSLFGVAVVYLYLDAEFLAAAQLLIYVGAILTLIIFGVMLTARIADPAVPRWNGQAGPAMILALLSGLALCGIFLSTSWSIPKTLPPPIDLPLLGRSLITTYLLPFEFLSILLLGALVGAVVVARKDPE